MLSYAEPPTLQLGEAASVSVSVSFQLYDFDGAPRTDSGTVKFRLRDRGVAGDEAVVFARQLINGAVTVALDLDAGGQFVLSLAPPFVADMQLSEPVQIKVE